MKKKKNTVREIITNKVFMSPLAGITDIPFRLLVQKYGCRFSFTEMIDANGLFYNNWKTLKMLDLDARECTKGVQIVGNDKKVLLYAAKLCADKGFGIIELNASCPVRKIVKDGKGAALLKDLKKLGKIVSTLTKSLNIPISVKIRSGWDDKHTNCLEAAKIIESEGASAICIHPRTRKQMYSDTPDHSLTKKIKDTLRIPVFASGNMFTPKDIINVLSETGCDAVAIARGALGRPWLFRDFYSYLNNEDYNLKIEFAELKGIINEHMILSDKFYKGRKIFPRMHKHMQWYLKGFKNRHNIVNTYRTVKNFHQFRVFMESLSLDSMGTLYFNSNIQNLHKTSHCFT